MGRVAGPLKSRVRSSCAQRTFAGKFHSNRSGSNVHRRTSGRSRAAAWLPPSLLGCTRIACTPASPSAWSQSVEIDKVRRKHVATQL